MRIQNLYLFHFRGMYLDFPRSRPIVPKPTSTNIKLGDAHKKPTAIVSAEKKPSVFIPANNVHEATVEDLPFLCQPEVRRAQKELLIKERLDFKEPAFPKSEKFEISLAAAGDVVELKTAPNRSRPPASARGEPTRDVSPSFKLTVKNVDDPGGTFKKTSPKFGRRSSINAAAAAAGNRSTAHKMRNRSKVIEGNREYSAAPAGIKSYGTVGDPSRNRSNNWMEPSFIILNEPCKQSKWMKPSWYA